MHDISAKWVSGPLKFVIMKQNVTLNHWGYGLHSPHLCATVVPPSSKCLDNRIWKYNGHFPYHVIIPYTLYQSQDPTELLAVRWEVWTCIAHHSLYFVYIAYTTYTFLKPYTFPIPLPCCLYHYNTSTFSTLSTLSTHYLHFSILFTLSLHYLHILYSISILIISASRIDQG